MNEEWRKTAVVIIILAGVLFLSALFSPVEKRGGGGLTRPAPGMAPL